MRLLVGTDVYQITNNVRTIIKIIKERIDVSAVNVKRPKELLRKARV